MSMSIGALAQWQREVKAGRQPTPALTHAACLDAAGLEAERMGLPTTAEAYFTRAAEVVVSAIATKAEAA